MFIIKFLKGYLNYPKIVKIMEKAKLNYLIDLLMGILFFCTAISGLVLFFFLPEGQRRGGYQEFLGIIRRNWVNFHNLSGLILLFFIIIHLFLHWRWFYETTKNFFKRK